MSAEC